MSVSQSTKRKQYDIPFNQPSVPVPSISPTMPISSLPPIHNMDIDLLSYTEATTGTMPLPIQPKSHTYHDVKLLLRNKPVNIFCPTCNQNVTTNLKSSRTKLFLFILLLVILVIGLFFIMDEYDDFRWPFHLGIFVLFCSIAVIGWILLRYNYHHVCPICGRDLGSRGDIVSRLSGFSAHL